MKLNRENVGHTRHSSISMPTHAARKIRAERTANSNGWTIKDLKEIPSKCWNAVKNIFINENNEFRRPNKESIKNIFTKISDWTSEKRKAITTSEIWEQYVIKHVVVQGLYFTIPSSIAAAYLFNITDFKKAALFGTLTYTISTVACEIIRLKWDFDEKILAPLHSASCVIGYATLSKCFNTNLTFKNTAILGIISAIGFVSRKFFEPEDADLPPGGNSDPF